MTIRNKQDKVILAVRIIVTRCSHIELVPKGWCLWKGLRTQLGTLLEGVVFVHICVCVILRGGSSENLVSMASKGLRTTYI